MKDKVRWWHCCPHKPAWVVDYEGTRLYLCEKHFDVAYRANRQMQKAPRVPVYQGRKREEKETQEVAVV